MYQFRAMNTTISTHYLSETQSRQTESWFHAVEKALSRFLPQSELSQFNRTFNRPFFASRLFFDVVRAADRFYKETGGLFNPYLGETICRLGYDRSFEQIQVGGTDAVHEKPQKNSESPVPPLLDHARQIITRQSGVIDLGGIGKGWAAQEAADTLIRRGTAQGGIAAGGDIIVWGWPSDAWTVHIAAPDSWDNKRFSLKLSRPAAIATSGTLRRKWIGADGQMKHHVLDPRTQTSSHSDLAQVSVLAPDLLTAEVYAKVLLILGWDKGIIQASSKHPELGFVGIRKDHTLVSAGALNNYISEGLIDHEQSACIHS